MVPRRPASLEVTVACCWLLTVILGFCISFNVDVKNSMSFSGPVEDMFGYTVQQYENEEGKWVLIGSPLVGQPKARTGDVYKCPVGRERAMPCVKLDLSESQRLWIRSRLRYIRFDQPRPPERSPMTQWPR